MSRVRQDLCQLGEFSGAVKIVSHWMLRRTIIRPALQVLGIYETALARRPFSTQLAVGSLLVVLGDSIAQHVIERKPMEKHDWQRTGNMVVLRGLFHSSVIILWYRFLQKKVPMTDYSKNVRLCAHLGLDQGLFGPANVTFFFLASGVLEGRTNEQIRQKLRDRLWETIVSGWIVWVSRNFRDSQCCLY